MLDRYQPPEYLHETNVDQDITAKTRELLQKYTTSGAMEPPGLIHELDPKEFKALKDSGTSDKARWL